MTSVSDNSSVVLATPGPTSSWNSENYIILLFSECPIWKPVPGNDSPLRVRVQELNANLIDPMQFG